MSTIGGITVPSQTPSGTFPLTTDWGFSRARAPEIAVHRFTSANGKIEQRFLLGDGATRYTVRRESLSDTEAQSLITFWEARSGPYQPFAYNLPDEDGDGTTAVTCRFETAPLSFEHLSDAICSCGVTLVEVPSSPPAYSVASMETRYPGTSLAAALLSQVQQLIPLLKITVKESGYPVIYLSDRACTVGGQAYEPRLLQWDGISQAMNGEADDATFVFGNADKVMRDLAADTNLLRATVEFSLYHVGTQIKLDLWAGVVRSHGGNEGPEYRILCDDGYDLGLSYPVRDITRTCWKDFDDGVNCPWTAEGTGSFTDCDKSFTNCAARGMEIYHGGIAARPQTVRIKETGAGWWGNGRNLISSVSQVAESQAGLPLQEIYTDQDMHVPCQIVAAREEQDFFSALGVVGLGPISAYATDGSKHRLDGQPAHGPLPLGLRRSYGHDPVQNNDPDADSDEFSLSAVGGGFTGDRAAGVAFLEIRRTDPPGLDLSRIVDHQMQAVVNSGLGGWTWSGGTRSWTNGLTNPIWIAVNAALKRKGLFQAAAAAQEAIFDVTSAQTAAGICATSVTKLIGSGSETQFKFVGTIGARRTLRDWLTDILTNCLGYWVSSSGKLKFGIRINSSAVEAFTAGNVIADSISLESINPDFNRLTATFANAEYDWKTDALPVADIDHAKFIGNSASPEFRDGQVNLAGTAGSSQAARIITTMLREKIGGISQAEWTAARRGTWQTTVLALNTEPGMVVSLTHDEVPGGAGEFRVKRWTLNPDYSITLEVETTTNSMYDLTSGPKPADVEPDPVPTEIITDPVPGDVTIIDATVTEDDKDAYVDVRYAPPGTDSSDIGTFAGVASHLESPDGSGNFVPAANSDYDGDPDAVDDTRYGTLRVVIPRPITAGAVDYEIFLASRSATYKKKLDPATTPSTVVEVNGTSLGGSPPSSVSSISLDPVDYSDPLFARITGTAAVPTTFNNFNGCEVFIIEDPTGTPRDPNPVGHQMHDPTDTVGPFSFDIKPPRPGFDGTWRLVFCARNSNAVQELADGAYVDVSISGRNGDGSGLAAEQPEDADLSYSITVYGNDSAGRNMARVDLEWGGPFARAVMMQAFIHEDTDDYSVSVGENATPYDGNDHFEMWFEQYAVARTIFVYVVASNPSYWYTPDANTATIEVTIPAAAAPTQLATFTCTTPVIKASPVPMGTFRFGYNKPSSEGGLFVYRVWMRWWNDAARTSLLEDWTAQGIIGMDRPAGANTEDFGEWPFAKTVQYRDVKLQSVSHAIDADGVNLENTDSPYIVELTIPASDGLDLSAVDSSTVGRGLTLTTNGMKVANSDPSAGLPNHDFEDGLTHWLYANCTPVVDTAVYRSGGQSIRIDGSAEASKYLWASDLFRVSPGDIWSLSAWMRSSAGADGTAKVRIVWYTTALAYVDEDSGNSVSPTTTWTESLIAGATVPATASYAQVFAMEVTSCTTGSWYVDLAMMRRSVRADEIPDGTVASEHIGDGEIDRLAMFPSNIRPQGIGSSLPTLPTSNYPAGSLFVLTTDNYVYRNSGGSTWVKTVSATDLVNFNTDEFQITGGAFVTKAINAEKMTLGSWLKIGGGGSKPGQLLIVDASNNTVVWGGGSGGYYGLYGQKIWGGGNDPSDAPLYIDASGNVVIESSGTGFNPILDLQSGSYRVQINASYGLQLTYGGAHTMVLNGQIFQGASTSDASYFSMDRYGLEFHGYNGYAAAILEDSNNGSDPAIGRLRLYNDGVLAVDVDAFGSGIIDLDGSYRVSGSQVINSSGAFVGAGVSTPLNGHAAAGFNPYVGGVQYNGVTSATFTTADGKTVTVKGGAITSVV